MQSINQVKNADVINFKFNGFFLSFCDQNVCTVICYFVSAIFQIIIIICLHDPVNLMIHSRMVIMIKTGVVCDFSTIGLKPWRGFQTLVVRWNELAIFRNGIYKFVSAGRTINQNNNMVISGFECENVINVFIFDMVILSRTNKKKVRASSSRKWVIRINIS